MFRIKYIVVCLLLTLTFQGFGAEVSETTDTVAANLLNEVVVTGSNSASGRNLIPYTVSIVGEKALENSAGNQLLSAISGRVPSLFVTERAGFGFGVSNGGSGSIKIRGVGGDAGSVLMMVDGQPQFAGIYSHHVADFYSKDYVEKVEVLRGPGSVLYGSNAMGGVINVITRHARRDGVHASLSAEYGSYDTWITNANVTARYGRFSALASVSFDSAKSPVKGLKFRQWDGYAKIGYNLSSHWNAALDFTLTNFHGADPVYAREYRDPPTDDIYHQNVSRGETALAVFNTYANTNGAARVYYSWGNHIIEDPKHFHSTDDRFGILLYQNINIKRNTDITLGFDFNTYSGAIPMSGGTAHTDGSISTISRKRITEYSPYVTVAQSLWDRQLIINAGLRVANSDIFHTELVPQGGLVVSPAHLFNIKLSVAKGYRNPSFKDLYLYRMANPDLQPERMLNYEVSVGKSFSRYFNIDVTGYYSRGSNLIQVLDMKNQNTGRFINKGIEVSASSRPLDCLSLSAMYSYLHTSLRNLTGAPRNQYFLGLDWHVVKPLELGAELKGVEGLFVSDGMKRQAYALLNIKAVYNFNAHINIFLKLNNITDAQYVINRGYDMPGFNLAGGFRVSL